VENETRPGHFKDKEGNWQKERRKQPDRRRPGPSIPPHDRRLFYRRKTDAEIRDRDAKNQIEEALEDFTEEHEGQAG